MKVEELQLDLSQLKAVGTYSRFLSKGKLEEVARQTGLVLRSDSKLTGQSFLEMLVSNIVPNGEWSLNEQCAYLREHFGYSLRKQSLDERYNSGAVSFVKACYGTLLSKQLGGYSTAISTGFDGIYLIDGTSWQLPGHLAAFYQSNGGATTGSSIKIHQVIELQRFRIADLVITDGKQADQQYWQQKHWEFKAGCLYIADLGYFSWDILTDIVKKGAHFLSRYKTNTALYITDKKGGFVSFDLAKHLRRKVNGTATSEVKVYVGKEKIAIRLICQAVPEQVRQERLKNYKRRYEKQSKKGRRWTMTEEKKRLCGYNLYITSAPTDKLGAENVFHVYTLRWQIELLFKIWKSLIHIDKMVSMSIFRFECFLYSRLIFILLSTELMSFIRSTLLENDITIELSEWKTIKLIKKTSVDSSKPL